MKKMQKKEEKLILQNLMYNLSQKKTQKAHAWQIKEGVAWKGSVKEVTCFRAE